MRIRTFPYLAALVLSAPADTVELRNRYPADGIYYLGSSTDPAACSMTPAGATWEVDETDGELTLLHPATGRALGFIDGEPAAVDREDAAPLRREDAGDGWLRLRSPEHGLLHTEERNGRLQVGGNARNDWWSAHWQMIHRTEIFTLHSPDDRASITFSLANGRPEFAIRFGNETLIAPSPLGFAFRDQPPLDGPFEVLGTDRRDIDETWEPVWGQHAEIRDHGRELVVRLRETADNPRRLDLVFRAYDDGVAFRYVLPEQPHLTDFEIIDERTAFHFTADADAWWCPEHPDTYERDYRETRLSEAAPRGMQTPATFRTAGGRYLSLHEADLTDWAGMKLKSPDPVAGLSLKAELVPWFESDVKVKGRAPARSPWRTVQLADRPGGLVESSLILNLNDPCALEDTSWIRPSKFMGIWWGMITNVWSWDHEIPEKHGATTERAKRYIDACAELGIDGLLVEGWCEGWAGGIPGWRNMEFTNPTEDFDILEVVRYGKEKGVKLVGHHETGGDIPNYEKQAEAAFDFYRRLGMDTVKTGYVTGDIPLHTDTPPGREHHHGQYAVRHHQRNVERAAEYGIMINAHEPIKATGLSRTWPNFIAREGARGGEFNAFVGNPPRHTTILPFTRILGGPMDYTPGLFDCAFQPDKPFATRANQLALYVVLWSPLQMAADHYQAYQGEPAAEFIRRVPVGDWDETRVLDAAIGDYVVTARRKGDRWYLGAVNDENSRTLRVSLDFLDDGGEYRAILYADAPDADYRSDPHAMRIEALDLAGGGDLTLELRPGGGAAVEIAPAGADLPLPSGDAGTPPADTPLMLRAKHSDRALTLSDNSVIQRGAGGDGQTWMLDPAGDGTWKILRNDRVLTAAGEGDGAAVLADTDRGEPNQRWRFHHVAGSYYRIANTASGRLLDVSENRYDDGAAIHLWENAHAANQVWWIDPLDEP